MKYEGIRFISTYNALWILGHHSSSEHQSLESHLVLEIPKLKSVLVYRLFEKDKAITCKRTVLHIIQGDSLHFLFAFIILVISSVFHQHFIVIVSYITAVIKKTGPCQLKYDDVEFFLKNIQILIKKIWVQIGLLKIIVFFSDSTKPFSSLFFFKIPMLSKMFQNKKVHQKSQLLVQMRFLFRLRKRTK